MDGNTRNTTPQRLGNRSSIVLNDEIPYEMMAHMMSLIECIRLSDACNKKIHLLLILHFTAKTKIQFFFVLFFCHFKYISLNKSKYLIKLSIHYSLSTELLMIRVSSLL